MEVHPYLQQRSFNDWLLAQGIHVVQFSPLGNMNDFYRATGWSKEVSHMTRVIDQPALRALAAKYGKSVVQVVLAWGVGAGRSVIPKSTVDWQIRENVEADFALEPADVEIIEALDMQARFNDPSLDADGSVSLLLERECSVIVLPCHARMIQRVGTPRWS